jgi:hypothetical protein
MILKLPSLAQKIFYGYVITVVAITDSYHVSYGNNS